MTSSATVHHLKCVGAGAERGDRGPTPPRCVPARAPVPGRRFPFVGAAAGVPGTGPCEQGKRPFGAGRRREPRVIDCIKAIANLLHILNDNRDPGYRPNQREVNGHEWIHSPPRWACFGARSVHVDIGLPRLRILRSCCCAGTSLSGRSSPCILWRRSTHGATDAPRSRRGRRGRGQPASAPGSDGPADARTATNSSASTHCATRTAASR
jgi:hypothetical protein